MWPSPTLDTISNVLAAAQRPQAEGPCPWLGPLDSVFPSSLASHTAPPGLRPHLCHRTFAQPALAPYMLLPGTSGAAGLAQLPEFSLLGPGTPLQPLPSDGGHAPSAQDNVLTSRAPPGPGAPWEWRPELFHPQACGQGASWFSAQIWSPTEHVHSRPPDYSRSPRSGTTKPAWASDSMTVKQLKPCLSQSSRWESAVKVLRVASGMFIQQIFSEHSPRAGHRIHTATAASETHRAPPGRGRDSHR